MSIRVISSDLDGAQLRREQRKNSRFIRAKGTHDEQDIMEADHNSKGVQWSINGEDWERIFGR